MVMDVNVIADVEDYTQRMSKLIDEIHAVETAAGVDKVILPGEREWQHYREAEANGVPLPEDVRAQLSDTTELAGRTPEWLS